MYKAEIMKMIDLHESKQNHVSISGKKATHSFMEHGILKAKRLNDLKALIKLELNLDLGNEYDEENQSYIVHIPEKFWEEKECPEHYEIRILKIIEKPVKMR